MKTDFPGLQADLSTTNSRDFDSRFSGREREEEEHEKLDAALRQSEQRFRALIEHSQDAIALFGADGAILYASPSTTQVIGYKPEELLQRNMLEFIRPDYLESVGESLAESLRHPGIGIPAESCIRHKDGGYRFLEGTFTNLLEEPSVGAIVNNYRDVTQRKQTEDALRESEARLRLSVEAANVGLWDWDLKTNQVYYSPEWKSQIGYHEDELSNEFSEWESRVHPDELESIMKKAEAYFADPEGRFYEVEFRLRHRDGNYRWIYAHADLLHGADGKPERMLGCHIDITERKQAEAELRESQRQLTSTVNNLSGFVYRCENRPNWPAEYMSQGVIDLTGYPAEDFMSGERVFGSFIVEADRDRVWADVQAALEARQPYVLEYRIVNAHGEEHWVWEKGGGVFDGNKLLALEGFVTDITDRKRAEEELHVTSEQLRALSARVEAAREEEGAHIAREIHDELGGVLTGMKWDLENCEKVLSASTSVDSIASIRKKILMITGLLDNTINTVRRISSELRPGVLDDLGLVAAIEWQAQQFQQRTGIECAFEAGLDTVDLNRDQAIAIFRVFQEVLTNVIRHAQATRIEIKMSEADCEFVLEVQDNGRGISEAERQNKRSLGLLGMHERVQLIGGRIEIRGEKGAGTRVVVRVPVRDPQVVRLATLAEKRDCQ